MNGTSVMAAVTALEVSSPARFPRLRMLNADRGFPSSERPVDYERRESRPRLQAETVGKILRARQSLRLSQERAMPSDTPVLCDIPTNL